jgi:hypothetical protein
MRHPTTTIVTGVLVLVLAVPAVVFARGDRDHECDADDRDCQRNAAQPARTSAKVNGPVNLEIEVMSADIEIVAGGNEVSVTAQGCGPDDLELEGDGSDFEIEFDPAGSCKSPVKIKVPAGSNIEVAAVEGDIKLTGQYKNVEAEAVSGDVTIESAEKVEVSAVSGKIKLPKVSKRADIESVSGSVELTTVGSSPIVNVEMVSGTLTWNGQCGKGCRVSVEAYQGDLTLGLDKTSSFELRFATMNGRLVDQLKMTIEQGGKNVMGASPVKAKFGKGEGQIRIESYDGDLTVKPR